MPKLKQNVVAITPGGELREEHFLGRLAMYSFPDEPVNGSKLVRTWAKHGLDVDDLPEARQPVHIFQSACASVRGHRMMNGNGRVEIAADEVENDPATCSYQITLRVWDRANRVIEHEKAMRVEFDKHASAITVTRLESWDRHMAAIEEEIRQHFDKNAKKVPGPKVRNAIRKTLLKIGAQNLRRKAGGVYFVPKDWRNGKLHPTLPILEGLASVLEELYGAANADFEMIPLIDDDARKEMVRKHFALNVNDKAQDLAEKAINRVRQGKTERGVRPELLTNLYNERRKLSQAVRQFDELVQVEHDEIKDKLTLLDKSIADLQKFVDEGSIA